MNEYANDLNKISDGDFDDIQQKPTSAVSLLDDYSFFSQKNLISMGQGLGISALSRTGIVTKKLSNSNLTAQDIISATKSVDAAAYFFKTLIKQYMSFGEKSEPNITFSKRIADIMGAKFRKAYQIARIASLSADKLANLFGGDIPGNGLPTQSQLTQKFRGMRLLFNPPVFPIAFCNLSFIPPNNAIHWLTYVYFEIIITTFQLTTDKTLVDLLKNLLFEEGTHNTLSAYNINYEQACKISREDALKNNPIVKENQKTLGGEYLLPDGREYVGKYHIHKDGTAMVGGKHPEDQRTIVLSKLLKRDDIGDA